MDGGANGPGPTLADCPVAELERLLARLRDGRVRAPLTRAGLGFAGLPRLVGPLTPFFSLDRAALEALLVAVLAERERQTSKLALVWSGPDEGASEARDTAAVVRDLVGSAGESVLVAGYALERRSGMFAALAEVMAERAVRAALFVDPDQLLRRKLRLAVPVEAYIEEAIATFVARTFAKGANVPEIYVDRRLYEADAFGPDGFPKVSLHAKCVVVDDTRALVTSANFTERGEKRNVEAGVLVSDIGFAKSLAGQFRRLASLGAMVRVR